MVSFIDQYPSVLSPWLSLEKLLKIMHHSRRSGIVLLDFIEEATKSVFKKIVSCHANIVLLAHSLINRHIIGQYLRLKELHWCIYIDKLFLITMSDENTKPTYHLKQRSPTSKIASPITQAIPTIITMDKPGK